ncbi:hypothetical protein Q8F55_003311 [Vanrija albida]|uniref:NADH dehydrogenase [ubiquinone] 1 beta subcomplex subunit 11, mitochondrial n=1 Tax=Vanrija albida TaxID=181172 RepID=A0ABR3Q3L9_9TREE
MNRLPRPLLPAPLRAAARPVALPRRLPQAARRSAYWQSKRDWWRRYAWEVDLDTPMLPLAVLEVCIIGWVVYDARRRKKKNEPEVNAYGDVVARDGEEQTYTAPPAPPPPRDPAPPAEPWNPKSVPPEERTRPPHGHPAIEWSLLEDE